MRHRRARCGAEQPVRRTPGRTAAGWKGPDVGGGRTCRGAGRRTARTGPAAQTLWRLDAAPLTLAELSGRAGRWNLRIGRPLEP
ncbi:hypothetical protein [Streptomyces sp. NBC_01180]|uniref:hypothetical protein n=1 Tax=unclassified Streptomyces TaxID=2593676 RepID=UPI003863B4EE